MKQLIKRVLINLARRIYKYYEINQTPIVIYKDRDYGLDPVLLGLTKGMVNQVEQKFSVQSGEFKRHQVLRAVLNSLPAATERDVAFAIELAVRNG